MKAITLTQPWATLVATGLKKVETRSWSTSYRGPLLIHAAVGFPAEARLFAEEERALMRLPARIPRGGIVARCRLARVVRTADASLEISALERRYGNYRHGRFAWFLEDLEPLAEPIAAKGMLGLWECAWPGEPEAAPGLFPNWRT